MSVTPQKFRARIMRYLAPLERKRHACEVRYVASWRDDQGFPDYERMRAYFVGVEEQRGREAADRLRDDVRDALRKGRRK